MSGMDRLTELLPCPFCGGGRSTTTYTRDGRLVVCTSCGAKSGNYYHGPKDLPSADERAIAAWNRRASQAAPAPSDGLRELADAWKAHCDAVEAYNSRRAIVEAERQRGSYGLNVDAEYQAMEAARVKWLQTAQNIAREALTPAPAKLRSDKDRPRLKPHNDR